MIRATLLLCLVLGVLGFVPDMKFVRERGNEIAKMAMNKQMSVSHLFVPDAHACFNGDCSGGIKVYDAYRDKFQYFSIDYTNLVAREGMESADWHVLTRNGDCEEWFHGHEVVYFAEDGRVKESHSFAFDQDAFDASIARSFACRARDL